MDTDGRIYLDYNASTPVCPEAVDAMVKAASSAWGNPSSGHWAGRQAKASVMVGRAEVAAVLGCAPAEVLVTSGGTESNNLAICGSLNAMWEERGMAAFSGHMITTDVEHPATREVAMELEKRGMRVTRIPTGESGVVRAEAVAEAVLSDTLIVSVMHANNETGCLQPVADISRLVRDKWPDRRPLIHTDASQSLGKVPCVVGELGVDLLTVCSHKFYGPKGIGALYVRSGVAIRRQLWGAQHERGLRPGTENVVLLAGMAAALGKAASTLGDSMEHSAAMRDRLRAKLSEGADVEQSGGDDTPRLPNTLSCALRQKGGGKYIKAAPLLAAVADSVAASAGSACHSDCVSVSYCLQALGIPVERCCGTLRLSVGRTTTPGEVDEAAKVILAAAKRQWET